MNKIIYRLLATILLLTTAAGTMAQDTSSVTMQWDTPGALTVYKGRTLLDVPANATTYNCEFDYDDFATLRIFASNGYELTSCKYTEGSNAVDVKKSAGGYYSIGVNELNGKTINITTSKIIPDSKLTLQIENGANKLSELMFVNTNTSYTTFQDGTQVYDFKASSEQDVTIEAKLGTSIYSVKLNGGTDRVQDSGNGRFFTIKNIADGDVLTIRVFETDPVDATKTVTLNYSEKAAGAVRNILNMTTLEILDFNTGSFQVDEGEVVKIIFDDEFDVTSATVDGQNYYNAESHAAQFTVTGDCTVNITASPKQYGVQTATLFLTEPNAFDIWAGTRINGERIQLGEGTVVNEEIKLFANEKDADYIVPAGTAYRYDIQFSSKYDCINYYVNEGFWLRTARGADARVDVINPISDKVIYLIGEAIANDAAMTVFVAGEAGHAQLRSGRLNGCDKRQMLDNGYQNIEFDSEYENPFTVAYLGVQKSFSAYLNGAVLTATDGNFADITIADGDILKIFVDTAVPAKKNVTVTVDDDMTAELYYDRTGHHQDLSVPHTNFVGSELCLVTDKTAEVSLDGVILTADKQNLEKQGSVKNDDGKTSYTFTITSDHALKVSKAGTGVADINTETALSDTIYDINGVPFGNSMDKLPKGIYIVNGKKVVI